MLITRSLFTIARRETLNRLQMAVLMSSRQASSTSQMQPGKTDWSANQYLKFGDERTIPVRDLLAKVPLASPKLIIDLGCGPGNSTSTLLDRYPAAQIVGVDSSPDMLRKARSALPNQTFIQADLDTYHPDESAELLFSNAVFHWLNPKDRIPIMKRLIETSSSGSVLAIQVPNNSQEPSHTSMREAARQEGSDAGLEESNPLNHVFPTPEELYNSLSPLCSRLEIWRTTYSHILEDHNAVVEWVKSTGLKPFIDPLSEAQRVSYLARYLSLIKESYKPLSDGKVMLRYPRLFVVATKA